MSSADQSNNDNARKNDLADYFARIAIFESARDNWKKGLSKSDIAFLEQVNELDTKISDRNGINYSRFNRK